MYVGVIPFLHRAGCCRSPAVWQGPVCGKRGRGRGRGRVPGGEPGRRAPLTGGAAPGPPRPGRARSEAPAAARGRRQRPPRSLTAAASFPSTGGPRSSARPGPARLVFCAHCWAPQDKGAWSPWSGTSRG